MSDSTMIPSGTGWNPEMRALILLAVQRLALEAGRPEPISAEEIAFIRARPSVEMLRMADLQRVTFLLNSSSELFDDANWHEYAQESFWDLRWWSMTQAVVAQRVMRAAKAVDARPLLVKGMALAALTTGDYTSRGWGDIDIVVAPESSVAAVDAIVAIGGHVIAGSPVRDQVEARNHHIHSTTLSLDDIHIDLHHRLGFNPMLMNMDHDALFDQRLEVEVGGVGLNTLGLLDSTLLAAHHSGHDAWPDLRSVMDMVRLLRLVDSGQDRKGLQGRAIAQHVGNRLVLAEKVCRPLGGVGGVGVVMPSGIGTGLASTMLAHAAWRRLARGESVRSSREPRARVYRNLFALASTGSRDAWLWNLRMLLARGTRVNRLS